MRRLAMLGLAPLTAAAVALAGCETSSGGTPSAAGTGPAGEASVTASPAPSASASGAIANTRQVCDAINKAVAEGASAFGTDLGTLAGHVAGGNKTAVTKARTDAIAHLKTLASKIRTAGGSAVNPGLKAAARDAADQMAALAGDPNLLSGVKSATDLPPVIEKLTRATDGLNKACA
jgi:hypothetical protein